MSESAPGVCRAGPSPSVTHSLSQSLRGLQFGAVCVKRSKTPAENASRAGIIRTHPVAYNLQLSGARVVGHPGAMHMYICIYVYCRYVIYVYMYMCICVYTHMCIYVYMYICTYVHMHTHSHSHENENAHAHAHAQVTDHSRMILEGRLNKHVGNATLHSMLILCCLLCDSTEFADYFCATCKLYSTPSSNGIYHCPQCGICRVGRGLGKSHFHCLACRGDFGVDDFLLHLYHSPDNTYGGS